MSWAELQSSLQNIEKNAILGAYVTNFDALNLSLVDYMLSENAPPALLPELVGFKTLCRDLENIIGQCSELQQIELAKLNSQISLFINFVRKHESDFKSCKSYSRKRSEEGPHNLIEFEDIVSTQNSWEKLPCACDEENSIGRLDSHSRDSVGRIWRQVLNKLQSFHDSLQIIIDTKQYCQEVVISSIEDYIKKIEELGNKNGIADSLNRVHVVTRTRYNFLMNHSFFSTTEVDMQLNRVKETWNDLHYSGNRALIERELGTKYESSRDISKRLNFFLKLGCGAAILLWAFSECFNNEKYGRHIWNDPTFAIFMFFGDLLLLLWMWGVSIQVWRYFGIDFIQLLGLQGTELETIFVPESMVYQSAIDLSIVYLISFIIFNKIVRGVFDLEGNISYAHWIPFLLACFFVYRVVVPWKHRKPWFKMLLDVILAPCNPVIFRDGFIGDILTSLVRVLLSMSFSIMYLIMNVVTWLRLLDDNNSTKSTQLLGEVVLQQHRKAPELWWKYVGLYPNFIVPFITLFPLWIRFMQCLRRSIESGQRWPHFGNALKYSVAFAVIAFGTFQPSVRGSLLWILGFIVATLYQFSWDITMDWGLLVPSTSPHASVSSWLGWSFRKNRLFGKDWLYLVVVVGNLFLRFAWTLTLLESSVSASHPSVMTTMLYHLGPLIAAAEVIRRMVWGFLRLEWEQLEVLGHPDMYYLNYDHTRATFIEIEPKLHEISTPNSLWKAIPDIPWLGITQSSSNNQKARLFESAVFAGCMLLVLLLAILS